jgi:hypothetical protein
LNSGQSLSLASFIRKIRLPVLKLNPVLYPLFVIIYVDYNIKEVGKEAAMIVNQFLTRKGWRVVAHSMLAVAGIVLLYLLTRMVSMDIQHGYPVNWWILGISFILLLFTVLLGSILAKAELTDWK